MHLRVDPNSGVPLGLQIARQIRLAAASGRVVPGERLPAARDLAADLGVNFHTVRKAYGDLEAEGLLVCRQGLGTFVTDAARALSAAELRALVRAHVERLAEDLAGAGVDAAALEKIVAEELTRALGARRPAR